jgi:5-methylcytosine-specific restriction endonuclease McrA
MEDNQNDYKTCNKCGNKQLKSEYHPSRQARYDWVCSPCQTKRLRSYKTTAEHKAAKRINERGSRRGAFDVGCGTRDFRHVAAELVAKRKADPSQDWHVDHIIPVAHGGCSCPSNLQVLSREEHLAKTAKEFRLPAA